MTGARLRYWLVLVALAGAASAAAPGAPVQDWSNVETVVITGHQSGPALWRVAKDNSEVWILPTVAPMPKSLEWDSHAVATILKGANILLLPPKAEVGVFEGLWFAMTDMDTIEQPDGTTLESTLPEPLRGRFVAARTRIGRDADRYDRFLGGIAALRLEGDYWNFADFSGDGAQRTIERLASSDGVRARAAAVYPAMDIVHDVPKMTPAAHLACLDFALQDIATETEHAAAAAQAWAIGDLEGMKAHYSEIRLDACLQQNASYAALRETAHRDMTNAIIAALQKPGKSVAVMPMGFFLRKGGVLERLQAAGLTVSGP